MNIIELLKTSMDSPLSIPVVILGVFLFATWLFLLRYMDMFRINLDTEDFLLGVKNNLKRRKGGKLIETLSIIDDAGTPMASVAKSILSKNTLDEGALHYAAEEAATIEIPKLQRNMYLISASGHVAQFLGLLGTIFSLMGLFGGNSELTLRAMGTMVQSALVTTALGLAAAMLIHLYNVILMERCRTIVNEMEKTSIELINFLVRDPEMVNRINASAVASAENQEQK